MVAGESRAPRNSDGVQPNLPKIAPVAANESRVDVSANEVRVSVVLPVLNEEKDIGRLLHEVLAQQPPAGGFEVIVVDGGSTDRTRDIVSELRCSWSNLYLMDNPRRLSSAGRNIGAFWARGEYVMFLDGHCSIPRNDYLVRMVDIFSSTGAACLCRPQPLKNLATGPWARAIAAARHSRLGHNPGSDIYSDTPAFCNPGSAGAAYARKYIIELAGYDERFDACEDVEFNQRVARAGLTSYRHPDLAIYYQPRASLATLFGQMARYGRGRARLMARHTDAIPWPLVIMTLGVSLAILLIALAYWRIVGTAVGAVVALAIVIFTLEGFRVGGFSKVSVRTSFALVVVCFALVVGFWQGLMEFPRFRRPRENVQIPQPGRRDESGESEPQ